MWNQTQSRCYKQGGTGLIAVGAVMAAAGLLLLFLCVPGWAWTALIGMALLASGWLLIRLGKNGR